MKKALSSDFTTGNIPMQLLKFALPFMVSNAMQVLIAQLTGAKQ